MIKLSVLLWLATFAGAKPKARKPTQVVSTAVQVEVTYGDRLTTFVITPVKEGGRIDFENNLGRRASRTITAADYAFLKSKLVDVEGPNNDRTFCIRNYVLVTTSNRQRLGCLGAPNPLARSLVERVNAMAVSF